MNFERGFPIPRHGNEDSRSSVTHGIPVPPESGIEHHHGSWTATSGGSGTVGGGDARATPRRPIPMDNGTVHGSESWNTINLEQPTPMGNGVTEDRNPTLERTILQRSGIARNANDWKSVIPGNLFPHRNGIGQSRNSWSPATPEKIVNQRSNTENGLESENWQDLIGMYTGLLKEDTVDKNGVLEDINPTPSKVRDYGNQNWVASNNKNATHRSSPSPYWNHTSNQASTTSDPYLKTNDPANWNSNLLATLVGSQNSSTHTSSANKAQTNGIHHISNRSAVPNSANQVESNSMRSTSWTSMLGSQRTMRFTSNNLINDAHNTEDGFPVAYQPGYKPNSPPRSAASSIIDSFPFAPITPDNQGKHMHSQRVPENGNFRVEGTSTPAKDSRENQTVSREDAENLYNELLQTIGDSPPSAISTTQKELGVPENTDEQGIDLNKTPQQKTPTRRKKHRPKVIREGKPKRTPKPKDPSDGTSNETRVKRKYVRKKGINILETQGDDVTKNIPVASVGKRKYVRKKGLEKFGDEQQSRMDDVATSVVGIPAKSCKKQLNFDLDPVAQDESYGIRSSQQGIDVNVETPARSCKKQLKFDLEPVAQDKGYGIRSSQEGININVNPQDIGQERRINSILERPAIEIAQQNISMQSGNQYELNVPITPLANTKHHALNMLARNMTIKNSIPEHDRRGNLYNKVNQRFHGEGIENLVLQADMVSTNLERVREPNLMSTPQSLASKGMLNLDERRGIKRQSPEQMCLNANTMDSLLLYQKLLLGVAHRAYDRNNLSSILLENSKKTKMQSEFQTLVSSEPSCIIPHKPRQETRQINGIYGNGSAMHLLTSSTEGVNPYKTMHVGGNVINGQFRPPMAATHYLQKHQVFSGMQHHPLRSVPERSQRYIQGHDIGSKTAIMSWNLPPPTPSKETSRYAVTAYPATSLEKRQTAKPNSYNQRLNGLNQMFQHHRNDPLKGYQQPTTVARGRPRKQKPELSVDDITYRLEGLHIYDGNKKEQHELVLYRGSNALIPFEPIKKRIPRPKVDLDPETDRLWRLLMGKEGSEGAETLENGKEKWWEEERRVFRGRADSFIARMHLVQGDRRFSRWKGSVVDSVIGVFLTQNVSDHLSSSAFMSLAAKFPPKLSTTKETCCQDGACEEPIEVAEPNGITKCHEKIKQPVPDQSFFVSSKPSEDMTHQISSTRGAANKQSGISEEEVILSQDSFDSSTTQTVDEIRSSSGSNSEADDVTTGFETSKQSDPPVNLIQEKDHSCHDNWSTLIDEPKASIHHLPKEPECSMQLPRMNGVDLNSSSSFIPANSLQQESFVSSGQYQMSATPGPQKAGLLHFGVLGKESTSSLPSSNSEITEACHTSNVTCSENETPKFAGSSQGQYNLPSSHPVHQENFQPEPPVCSSQILNTNHPQVGEFFKETTRHGETLAKGKNGAQKQDTPMFEGIPSLVDKQICFENTVPEAKAKEQNHSSHEPPSGAGTNMSKAQKRKAEDERNRAFDWDSLRKEALSNGEKGERSKDATDSLDYEALRRAHVSEISDAIRERGMNNLLADRIKDFLNRLVRDHGKIDLEWLRDAPPDKAKDYLLSVRGLGLKSVECVRLLTLHHLAFPVDTNVGRIAVRLGWVPLQPLPESLQLHLLEMYPVLESIQKYLWPRLCKLDQLTLYELHYQMITFGKVFCTKSKPNCNACPMRAECRHFASAFASARLALPGPEEKRIVTSDAPVATDPIPPMVIRPMPLPQAENGFDKSERSFGRNCEPIIEEPTTPEPEAAELSISDIEDQYYEDSDEIPSIKLNMEEFTTNLQNIMQDSMELQDDMSKALVALNPNAASIPTPKLKDVSRLRTEHQVYELPDSHRLLEGLDKREPDDPSPYLLAIWTPGETANSVQPPERECSAQQSGKLCDRTTCFSCNNIKEANSQVVRGTILIPCRTAMRGSFPLNGTYFQVNEMFADHASSMNPIDVPRTWIWNLPRRTVYFGTSVSTIFKGLTTGGIQYCFWKGFVCVRGFDRKTRAPRPLMARLHFPASKI
ncbi:DNA glycosylase [Cynara cardunculus var. scolymus]|uniref:DNA glycosylase n=1 Tax=Cynara cardunculus var. scolymus TaxID=59895 RepID=A0A103YIA8_CYNCS|nr:DNA glycosylase [Cynara cardunculus var. scolymus]